MEYLTNILTRAITMRDLHHAMAHTGSSTGAVVWYLDAYCVLQTSHEMPQSMTPCVVLTQYTGALDLYHGALIVKRLATLSPVRVC